MSTRALLELAALALGVLAAPRAHGQGAPAPDALEHARERFRAGLEAMERHEPDAARAAFAESYALYPRPQTLLDLATAQVQSGQLQDGAASYRRLLRESVDEPSAPYRIAATRALTEVERRVPHVTLAVQGVAQSDVVQLDGWAVAPEQLGRETPVDPGQHVVAVLRGRSVVARTNLTIVQGQRARVVLVLAPGGVLRIRTTDLRPRPVVTSPWFWTSVGVVAAGAGIALGFALAPQVYQGNAMPGSFGVQ